MGRGVRAIKSVPCNSRGCRPASLSGYRQGVGRQSRVSTSRRSTEGHGALMVRQRMDGGWTSPRR